MIIGIHITKNQKVKYGFETGSKNRKNLNRFQTRNHKIKIN